MIDPFEAFTDRHRHILASLAAGKSQAAIADDIGLSLGSVRRITGEMRDMCGAETTVHMIVLAYQHGALT